MEERLEELLAQQCLVVDLPGVIYELEKPENKELITKENRFKIIDAINIRKDISSYGIGKYYDFITKYFNDKETIRYFFDQVIKENIQFDYKDREMVELLGKIPNSYITFEDIKKIADIMTFDRSNAKNDFLKNIPRELQTSETYDYILNKIVERIKETDKNDSYRLGELKDAVNDVFHKVPNSIKTAEMFLNCFEYDFKTYVINDINSLRNDFEKKNLYPQLMVSIGKHLSYWDKEKALNIIPGKYKTEEYIKMLFKGMAEGKSDYVDVGNVLKFLKGTYSIEFYKELIKTFPDGNGLQIYKSIPEQYKNQSDELFCLSLRSNINNSRNVANLVEYHLPKDESAYDVYDKILKCFKSESRNNYVLSKNYETLLGNMSVGIKDWKERNNYKKTLIQPLIENVKKVKVKDNQEIYTPNATFLLYEKLKHSFGMVFFNNEYELLMQEIKDKTQIHEYIAEIIENEKRNIESKTINLEQIREYEYELNIDKLTDSSEVKDDAIRNKNPFWSLCVFMNTIPETLRNEYREKIYAIIKEDLKIYDNGNNTNTIKFLQEIMDNNEELFLTLDNEFFIDDKYINTFGKEKFEILIAYPEIQRSIVEMSENKLKLFSNYINYSEKDLYNQDTKIHDWVPIADIVLKGMKNQKFAEINDIMENQDFNTLSDDIKQKYLHVISKGTNWFNVQTIEDLEKYEETRKNTCLDILNNNNENLTAQIKTMTQRDRKIFAVLQLKFGLDIPEAINLVNKYEIGLNKEQRTEGMGLTLKRIKEIINTKDEKLDDLIKEIDIDATSQTNIVLMQNLESKCRESYMKQYQKAVFKYKENADNTVNFAAEYNGNKINVIEPKGNFNMIVHALGAYSTHGNRNDYKKDWNMPKVVNHGLCTSFISNDNLGTAQIETVLYGFDNFTPEQLQLSSPWDIVSRGANTEFSISSVRHNYQNGVRFYNPKGQIDNTRHTHNEMVFERRQFFKDKKFEKMQPSYIVYMPDYSKGRTSEQIDEFLANRDNKLKEFMENDSKWKQAQKAAGQFGIPIVIVDRAKIAMQEQQKLERIVSRIEENKKFELIPKLICEFENNRTGNRDYHKEICNKFFDKKVLDGYMKRVENAIENLPTKGQRHEAYELLKNSYAMEMKKREEFKKTNDDVIAKEWQNRMYNASTRENNNSKSDVSELEGVIDKLQENSMANMIDKRIIDEIKKTEVNNSEINDDTPLKRHKQNVILFSYILGKKLNLDKNDLNLLVDSAKYYESAKISDSRQRHASQSAELAEKYLKDKYDENDLKVIKIAIEYNEPLELQKGKFDERIFNNINSKDQYRLNGESFEKAKIICQALKDADILDRTRLVKKSKFDPAYLHTDEARELQNFSTDINMEYAKNDVELYISNNEEIKEKVEKLNQDNENNYMATIYDIKHGKLFNVEKLYTDYIEATKDIDDSLEELEENYQSIDEKQMQEVTKEIVDLKSKHTDKDIELSNIKDNTELKEIVDNIKSTNQNNDLKIDDNIYREIIDMKSTGLYEDKKMHSERHIQNVMLFSSILGEKRNLNEKDMQLLIESAKYHDSGRNSDNDRNHAEPSAIVAGEKLKDKYDETDLKIIQIAVEYHEVRESQKGKLDNRALEYLFKKYELDEAEEDRTKTICEILKDADALDRTRFVGKAKLDEDYLHSKQTKDLVGFAKQINEQYAKNDLTKYCIENDGIEESINKYMEENGTDCMHTIRAIRKGYFEPTKNIVSSSQELKENADRISNDEIIKVEKSMIEKSLKGSIEKDR